MLQPVIYDVLLFNRQLYSINLIFVQLNPFPLVRTNIFLQPNLSLFRKSFYLFPRYWSKRNFGKYVYDKIKRVFIKQIELELIFYQLKYLFKSEGGYCYETSFKYEINTDYRNWCIGCDVVIK